MIRLDPVSWPPGVPDDVEWFLRCLILYGASDVKVDIEDKRVRGIRFSFRGGPERHVLYDRPALPCLVMGRGKS